MSTIYIKHTATSIHEYIEVIKSINQSYNGNKKELWYRGQIDSSWRLTPSGVRSMKPYKNYKGDRISTPSLMNGDTYVGPSLKNMLDEFKRRSLPFLKERPSNEFEWMFLAQHHHLPTRLLDWTRNPLVGLYFSLSDSEYDYQDIDVALNEFEENEFTDKGAAVFVMDPAEINMIIHGIPRAIDIASFPEEWSCYSEYSNDREHHPICILGTYLDDRIRAQSGNFTLHGTNIWSLDYYTALQQKIHKIFIPNASIQEIKLDLEDLGINEAFIYPGLDTLSYEIKAKEENQFIWSYSNEKNEAGK